MRSLGVRFRQGSCKYLKQIIAHTVKNPFGLPRKQVLSLMGHHLELRTERKKESAHHFPERGRDQYLVRGLCHGARRAKGQVKERSPGGAVLAQAGASRAVATLQYLGKGIPGSADDSMAFGETT